MRPGESFPNDQAEVVFSEQAIEWLAEHNDADANAVIDDIVALCRSPWGKHRLSNRHAGDRLAGLNTAETLCGDQRIIFRSRTVDGVGLVEVICIGPRTGNRVYDLANMLVSTGKLSDEEVADIWDMLAILGTTADHPGLEGWDHAPEPAPPGLVKAAVASGALTEEVAARLSIEELTAAMAAAFDTPTGRPDPHRGTSASLGPESQLALSGRAEPRCGALMPRAQRPCVRRAGHPGPHRSVLSLPKRRR